MISHKYDHFFKLLILGESSVGKTCILMRFTDDEFNINHLATIGNQILTKALTSISKL
jgi:GTPase SAR1 family protein